MSRKYVLGLLAVLILITIIVFNIPSTVLSHQEENVHRTSWTSLFGIDVSHYQGVINWSELSASKHDIRYIFIRATMGKDGKDIMFADNWKKAKQFNYIRGAYHYYRPHENSTEQFNNFKATVQIDSGDFVPILDIEKESPLGRENLRKGVQNWLKLAEKEYGVKPMVYTGLNFYRYVLDGYIDDYPLWIAAYSGPHRLRSVDWTFHQFSETIKVKGIKYSVDGNNFNGDFEELNEFVITE